MKPSFTRRKFPYSKISITKQGILYILILVIIGFASFNSGNNMIYLIFAISLSIFGASSYLAVKNLNGIDVKVDMPKEIYTKKDTFFTVAVSSLDKMKKFLLDIELLGHKIHFDAVKEEEKKSIRLNFEKRGRYEIKNVKVSSSYPFGFFIRTKEKTINEKFYVFPEVGEIRIKNRALSGINASKESNDGDFYSIDKYKDGSDARRISWKISAKLGDLHIINVADVSEGNLVVVFNNSSTLYSSQNFEVAIKKIASLVYKFYHEGVKFEFISPKLDIECINYENYLKIMKCLAEVKLENIEPIKVEKGITDENIEFV